MALNIQKAITLTGESHIEDELVVVWTSHIPDNGVAGAINPSIRNLDLYNEHRSEVRQDQRAFQDAVWDTEDSMNVVE